MGGCIAFFCNFEAYFKISDFRIQGFKDLTISSPTNAWLKCLVSWLLILLSKY